MQRWLFLLIMLANNFIYYLGLPESFTGSFIHLAYYITHRYSLITVIITGKCFVFISTECCIVWSSANRWSIQSGKQYGKVKVIQYKCYKMFEILIIAFLLNNFYTKRKLLIYLKVYGWSRDIFRIWPNVTIKCWSFFLIYNFYTILIFILILLMELNKKSS